MEKSKIKLILASASPRRLELMGHLKIPFDVVISGVNEFSDKINPDDFALEIAFQKGDAVAQKLMLEKKSSSYLIISADTVVALDGKIYGKPKDRDEARIFLTELSGKMHSVYTGVWGFYLEENRILTYSFVEKTDVHFEKIDPYVLENYLNTNDSLDKAGAYGIQGPSLTFVGHIQGGYSNVVGFPLNRFIKETAFFFKKIFPDEDTWQKLF